jgi:hypothetical protein
VLLVIFCVLAVSLWNGFVKGVFIKEGFEDGVETPDVNTPDVDTPTIDATDSIPYTEGKTVETASSTQVPTTKPLSEPSTQAPTTKPLSEPSTQVPTTKPLSEPLAEDDETMDIAIENSTKLVELFDKVNTQMDIIRTLKTPYSNKIIEIKYLTDDTVSPDTLIQTNLLHLIRNGISPNDKDLQTNPGIKTLYPYGGMSAIIDKLAQSISIQCTTVTDINKCYRMSNQKNIARIENIINTHQTILDKIMEKQ